MPADKVVNLAQELNAIMGRRDSYEYLVGLLTGFAVSSLPNITKTLERYAEAIRPEMSLGEQKQVF